MWRLAPGQTLRSLQFGDEYVLFNNLSGATHLLGTAAIELLSLLHHSPCEDALLQRSLAQRLGCDPDPEFAEEAEALLEQLRSLSLVERAC